MSGGGIIILRVIRRHFLACGRGPSCRPLHVQSTSDACRSLTTLTTPRREHHGGGRRRGLGREQHEGREDHSQPWEVGAGGPAGTGLALAARGRRDRRNTTNVECQSNDQGWHNCLLTKLTPCTIIFYRKKRKTRLIREITFLKLPSFDFVSQLKLLGKCVRLPSSSQGMFAT